MLFKYPIVGDVYFRIKLPGSVSHFWRQPIEMHGLLWQIVKTPNNRCVFETLGEQLSQSWWRGVVVSEAGQQEEGRLPVVGFFSSLWFFRLDIFGFNSFLLNSEARFLFCVCSFTFSRKHKVCSWDFIPETMSVVAFYTHMERFDKQIVCWCCKRAKMICLFMFMKCDLGVKPVLFVWLEVVRMRLRF